MKPVLPIVIKSGQLCTVEKKNILFGINNILSIISNVKQRKSEACVLTLDFFSIRFFDKSDEKNELW